VLKVLLLDFGLSELASYMFILSFKAGFKKNNCGKIDKYIHIFCDSPTISAITCTIHVSHCYIPTFGKSKIKILWKNTMCRPSLSSASRYSTVLFEWDIMAMMIFPDT
jgi:hypothetical protein